MASGWNLWVWLQCIGVASRCCYNIDILIIIINFPYSTCIRSFFGNSILTSLFIFKMFFRSFIIIVKINICILVFPVTFIINNNNYY